MTEKSNQEVFQGPVELNETVVLPQTPMTSQLVHKDHFLVEGLDMDQEDIKSIVLPKYVMNQLNPTVGYLEKSLVHITFHGNHRNSVYREIIRIANQGLETFKIHFVDPETTEILSTWEFHDPIIHAIDFGIAAQLRSEPAELSVEFDYSKFSIDEYSI